MQAVYYELTDMAREHVLTVDGRCLPCTGGLVDPGVAQFRCQEDAELTRRILLGLDIYVQVQSSLGNGDTRSLRPDFGRNLRLRPGRQPSSAEPPDKPGS